MTHDMGLTILGSLPTAKHHFERIWDPWTLWKTGPERQLPYSQVEPFHGGVCWYLAHPAIRKKRPACRTWVSGDLQCKQSEPIYMKDHAGFTKTDVIAQDMYRSTTCTMWVSGPLVVSYFIKPCGFKRNQPRLPEANLQWSIIWEAEDLAWGWPATWTWSGPHPWFCLEKAWWRLLESFCIAAFPLESTPLLLTFARLRNYMEQVRDRPLTGRANHFCLTKSTPDPLAEGYTFGAAVRSRASSWFVLDRCFQWPGNSSRHRIRICVLSFGPISQHY